MGHLKLKDGTKFPINLSVGDIRDISKRSGTFSKTITLVGDDDNNNLLNHYYDVNIVAGTFDINKLQQCQVIQNGIVILDNAYMQLVEVVKSQSTDAHNQSIEYKVLVKDSVSDFFTKLGNKTLDEININQIVFGTGSATYDSASVITSFSNDIDDGYKYLMPYDGGNTFNVKAFHPAIYAKIYFDAIFEGTGFTYEWGNQSPWVNTTNDNYFEKLLIPYNGGTPSIDRDDYLVEATYSDGTGMIGGSGLSWDAQVTGLTEVTDGESIFDPVNGDYSVPFWCQNPENIQIQVTYNIDVDITNNGVALATRSGSGSTEIQAATSSNAGTTFGGFNNLATVTPPATIAASTTTSLLSGYSGTTTFSITNLDNLDTLELYIRSITNATISYDQSVDIDVTINSSTWKIIPSADTVGYQSTVDLNLYIPKQIKQAEFIKSIFMMYNLYAEVDSSQPNKLVLQSRDDYYDSGNELDWTEKLAKDREQTIQFLPELSAKKTVLSYKDDDDDPNKVYLEATNETYGQLEFTYENEYVKGIDRKELIFSPTPIGSTSFNAIVPLIGYIPETNIRILVDGGTQTCDPYDIYNYYSGGTGVGSTGQTTAPLITHFDDPITPTFDLNFATCDYYFYDDLSTKTNNTLFNLYWRRTLGQIDKGKMLTAYFDLNEVDIQSLNLNDKIRIDNSWWNINRVIDYDANERALTKVELISVDEEVELTPFAESPTIPTKPTTTTRPVRPIRPTRPETTRPIKNIIEVNRLAKNLWYPSQDVVMLGMNNVIQPTVKRAVVVGEGQTIEDDGVHTEKLFINGVETTGNFANTDLTFTGDRSHNTDGNLFEITTDDGAYNEGWIYMDDSGFSQGTWIGYGSNSVHVESSKTTYTVSNNDIVQNSTETILNDNGANIDTRIEGQTDANLFFSDASTNRVGIGTNTPVEKLHCTDVVRADTGFDVNGTAGLSGTYTFGGGSSGDIASMTFTGGILTAVTTVP